MRWLLPLLLVSSAYAAPLTFAWDYPSADYDRVDGFRLVCGSVMMWEGKALETAPVDFPIGEQACHVVAYLGTEVSGPSDTLTFTIENVPDPINIYLR